LSVEKKSYDQLITSKITKNFIILHFGLGIEDDFETLKKFLHEIPSIKSPFLIDIYPGYPHGFLEFTDIEDSQNLVETLKALN
jgi:alkylated DNA repair protein alkB family protein 8